ncbi:hypothetical protein K1719_047478 [Acacia pycnantha]|nr:hypothetical protein K1719_047478 [Acacia pycnantha]
MKNVAKCDTWCELQNPVNHRVFERKLRPKPSGRGHACLGVTQRRQRPILRAWRMMASREPRLPAGRRGAGEGESPVVPDPVAPRGAVGESGCLGMQPQSGGKFRPRLNTARDR